MRRLMLSAALLAGTSLVAPAVMPANASACGNDYGVPGVIYVNDTPTAWIYLEYNGNDTLQQGGVSLLGEYAPCTDAGPPDMLLI